MKHCLLSAIALLTAGTLFAQAPTAAKQAFEKGFPGASNVKWEKEKTDYEVHFIQKGKEMSAVYDAAGKLIETEEAIAVSALPGSVVAYVKQHYKSPIKEAAKITKANGTMLYEAEVNKTDVMFDAAGNFVEAKKD